MKINHVWVNMVVCIVESDAFVVTVIDVALDDYDFVSVRVSVHVSY